MAGKLMAELDYAHDKVAGALYRAYRRRPSRYEALLILCHLLNQRGDFDECYRISSFEPKPMADGLFVDHNATWRLCAEHAYAAHNIGKPDEAQAYLRMASDILDASPKAESWLDLSHAYYRLDDWQKCIEATNKALSLKPDFAAAYLNRCAAYNMLGEFEQAKIAGEEAVRLMPNNQLAMNNLKWAIDNIQKNNQEK
jgi:tetratricopeptide (TPR) repeat protein